MSVVYVISYVYTIHICTFTRFTTRQILSAQWSMQLSFLGSPREMVNYFHFPVPEAHQAHWFSLNSSDEENFQFVAAV